MSNAAPMNMGSSLPPVGGAGGSMVQETKAIGNDFKLE